MKPASRARAATCCRHRLGQHDGSQQASATHLGDERMAKRQNGIRKVLASSGRVGEQAFCLDGLEDRQCSRRRERVAAEGRAVLPGREHPGRPRGRRR